MPHNILVFNRQEPQNIPVGKPRQQGGSVHFPGGDAQRQRLAPQLQRLSEAFEHHRAAVQRDIQGLDPESVIVFEVAEGVDSFITAARHAGMEWMGDWDSMMDADDDFYIDEDQTKKVPEKLYFTMSDQRALEQMLSLWQRYQGGDERFERGFGGFRKVFEQLRNVRLWNVQDRFYDTGVDTVWEAALQNNAATIRFEIELWYRENGDKRREAQNQITHIIEQFAGSVIRVSEYPEIAYHGMIAECPADGIRAMMNNPSNPLFNANQVMWIRATGQALAHTETSDITEQRDSFPLGRLDNPVIALFDGLPLAGHSLLNGRLDVNDADGYEDQYSVEQRQHGTEMASVILYGDLSHPFSPLHSRLYSRVIMKPNGLGEEAVPDDKLFVDVLHQAVMEIVNDPVLKSSIRIINLSVGDLSRQFSYALSPAAKMLDYLGERYNLLFIVSAGNENSVLDMPMTFGEYDQLGLNEKYKAVYDYLWNEQAGMRILSPSESVNSVTVGALSRDNSMPPTIANIVDLVPEGSVTSYSRFGGGYNRSIKPDLVNMGGRLFYSILGTRQSEARFRTAKPSISFGPGIKTAFPSNGLAGTAFSSGTSHATALTSRMCADFLDVLRSVPQLNIPAEYEATALKAMLIHCCSWKYMDSDMKQYVPVTGRQIRKEVLKWIGYGAPNPEISSFCTDQRVTLIGYDVLSPGKQVNMQFPLPQSLISQKTLKRLTLTLAWMSPVAANRKNYRVAKLDFKPSSNPLMENTTQDSDAYTSHRGTVQHEVYEDDSARTFQVNDNLVITVSCRNDDLLRSPVKFVLMATLEVAEETQYPIYQEVAIKLRNQVRVGS